MFVSPYSPMWVMSTTCSVWRRKDVDDMLAFHGEPFPFASSVMYESFSHLIFSDIDFYFCLFMACLLAINRQSMWKWKLGRSLSRAQEERYHVISNTCHAICVWPDRRNESSMFASIFGMPVGSSWLVCGPSVLTLKICSPVLSKDLCIRCASYTLTSLSTLHSMAEPWRFVTS